MRSKLILVLAIVMGLVTTYLFYTYMSQFSSETVSSENMEEIVVAKKDLRENQQVGLDMVELRAIPTDYIPTGAIKRLEDVTGAFMTADVGVGEYITSNRIKQQDEEDLFISKKVTEGFRAVSIGTNIIQSVSNLVEPEDYVDIIFSETFQINGAETKVESKVLLSRVRVLAVGKRMIEKDGVLEEVEFGSVTLELKQADTVKLVNASERGNLHLTIHTRIVPPKGAEGNGTDKQ